jgi:hypothetical protein
MSYSYSPLRRSCIPIASSLREQSDNFCWCFSLIPSSLPSGFLARNTRSPHSLCRSHASLSPNVCQTSMHHLIAGWLTARRTAYTRSPSTIRPACLSSLLSLTPPLQAVCPRGRRFPRCTRRDPPTTLPSRASRGASDARERRSRSRQPNTHSTESREVCYPWHPWFGRAVAVYEVLVRQGHSVCRCGLEEERNRRSIEIPTWMFEPATCGRLRVLSVPTVSCDALLELQGLLRTVQHPDHGGVLQAQHRSLLDAGGADATVREPTPLGATHAVSSPPPASVVSDVAARHPREDDPVAGAAAASARRPRSHRRPDEGGVR